MDLPGPASALSHERTEGWAAGLRLAALTLAGHPDPERFAAESGSCRDLEEANAFVMSLDTRRSWIRYHHLSADLLQLELRRTAPGEIPALHATAAGWFDQRGFPVQAIRHAQAARDWDLAARLLVRQWVSLVLDGQAATAHEFLTAFPAGMAEADTELTALLGADELKRDRWRRLGGIWRPLPAG